jgi:rfaE bifunctional protein nucleotidyltransferase chain/domain
MKIFVNGSFDLLHLGHISLLNYARSLGSYLLVAVDSDERISSLKGTHRPINCLDVRKCILENLKAVDQVVTFSSDEQLVTHIKNYAPDIMVKGSDWQGKCIVGSQYCKDIVFYSRVGGYSSTNIINSFVSKL